MTGDATNPLVVLAIANLEDAGECVHSRDLAGNQDVATTCGSRPACCYGA